MKDIVHATLNMKRLNGTMPCYGFLCPFFVLCLWLSDMVGAHGDHA